METIGIVLLKLVASFAVSMALLGIWMWIAVSVAVWLEDHGVAFETGSDVVQAMVVNWPAVIVIYGAGIVFYFYCDDLWMLL